MSVSKLSSRVRTRNHRRSFGETDFREKKKSFYEIECSKSGTDVFVKQGMSESRYILRWKNQVIHVVGGISSITGR